MATKTNKVDIAPEDEGDQGQSTVGLGSVVDDTGDLLSLGQVDRALAAKMHLVNVVSGILSKKSGVISRLF